MPTPFKGNLVITGSSTGIGEACVLRLAQKNFRIFAIIRKASDGERLKTQNPKNIVPIFFDVRDEKAIARGAAQVQKIVGDSGLNGLVNNAGIAVAAPLECLPIDDFRLQLEVNVVGQLAVTQAFLPMIRQAKGRICFISSINGILATPMNVKSECHLRSCSIMRCWQKRLESALGMAKNTDFIRTKLPTLLKRRCFPLALAIDT